MITGKLEETDLTQTGLWQGSCRWPIVLIRSVTDRQWQIQETCWPRFLIAPSYAGDLGDRVGRHQLCVIARRAIARFVVSYRRTPTAVVFRGNVARISLSLRPWLSSAPLVPTKACWHTLAESFRQKAFADISSPGEWYNCYIWLLKTSFTIRFGQNPKGWSTWTRNFWGSRLRELKCEHSRQSAAACRSRLAVFTKLFCYCNMFAIWLAQYESLLLIMKAFAYEFTMICSVSESVAAYDMTSYEVTPSRAPKPRWLGRRHLQQAHRLLQHCLGFREPAFWGIVEI